MPTGTNCYPNQGISTASVAPAPASPISEQCFGMIVKERERLERLVALAESKLERVMVQDYPTGNKEVEVANAEWPQYLAAIRCEIEFVSKYISQLYGLIDRVAF